MARFWCFLMHWALLACAASSPGPLNDAATDAPLDVSGDRVQVTDYCNTGAPVIAETYATDWRVDEGICAPEVYDCTLRAFNRRGVGSLARELAACDPTGRCYSRCFDPVLNQCARPACESVGACWAGCWQAHCAGVAAADAHACLVAARTGPCLTEFTLFQTCVGRRVDGCLEPTAMRCRAASSDATVDAQADAGLPNADATSDANPVDAGING